MDSKIDVDVVNEMTEIFLSEDVIDVKVNVSSDGKYATIIIVLKLKE